MADYINAFILGLVEGLTEFIPVSSTGHLIVVGEVLNFTGERAHTFEIFIQLGAILAVLRLYWDRFRKLLDFDSSGEFAGKLGIQKLAVACLPAFVLGFLAHDFIKTQLFTPGSVAVALIVGGLVLIWVEIRTAPPPRTTKLEDLSLGQCFGIGLFQCLSLWPGVSRAGSTIVGAMLLGGSRTVAAEFSFLVAVPVMFAAVGYDLLKSIGALGFGDIGIFAVGLIVAFVSALWAIRWFLALLNTLTLKPFGYYRIAFGLLVLVLLGR